MALTLGPPRLPGRGMIFGLCLKLIFLIVTRTVSLLC